MTLYCKPNRNKTQIWLLAIALFISVAGFSGCSKADFNKNFIIEKDFTIKGSGTSSDLSEVLDATVDGDFDKYKKKIKSVTITKVGYFLPTFNGTATQTLTDGKFLAGAESEDKPTTELAHLTNINLMSIGATERELPLNEAGKVKLVDLLKNDPHKAKVRITATVNEAPVDLKLRIKIYVRITANALK